MGRLSPLYITVIIRRGGKWESIGMDLHEKDVIACGKDSLLRSCLVIFWFDDDDDAEWEGMCDIREALR